MKYAKWKYRFMHNRLTEMGFNPTKINFKRADSSIYVGIYHKGKTLIHIEDMIKNYQEFVEANQ